LTSCGDCRIVRYRPESKILDFYTSILDKSEISDPPGRGIEIRFGRKSANVSIVVDADRVLAHHVGTALVVGFDFRTGVSFIRPGGAKAD
jgi:hypothetical protein